jgi:hypothetical protein
MAARTKPLALTIRAKTPSPASLRQLAGNKSNIYYFRSPKNHCRLIFLGQLEFFLGILLEADVNVVAYRPVSVDLSPEGGPHLLAQLTNGNEVRYVTRYDSEAKRVARPRHPSDTGRVIVVTEGALREKQVELENWIFLCSAMTRAGSYAHIAEEEALQRALTQTGDVSIGHLLAIDGIEPACMLAAIGEGLQRGTLLCNSATEPLTLCTRLCARRLS